MGESPEIHLKDIAEDIEAKPILSNISHSVRGLHEYVFNPKHAFAEDVAAYYSLSPNRWTGMPVPQRFERFLMQAFYNNSLMFEEGYERNQKYKELLENGVSPNVARRQLLPFSDS